MSAVPDNCEPPNRLGRREQRTRTALVKAAQRLIAEGKVNVPVLEITQAADVGMGSFYNHFDSKEQLFQAAVNEVLDYYAELLDKLKSDDDAPAETFARSFRLVGRLFRRRPDMSRGLVNSGLALITSDRGLSPRELRDIEAATRAGRFTVDAPVLALSVASGALMGLGQLLHDQPERDDADAADRVTTDVLIMFGVPADEAAEICRRPLPDLDELTEPNSAA